MNLFEHYVNSADRYDELLAADGKPRQHWRALIDQLADQGPRAMLDAREALQRQIVTNGVTYNVYADPRGADRPWDLDLLPQIVPAEEWAQVEQAIAQRASLLNMVLADLYGPQRLIEHGLVPPSAIYGHPGYLRPCRGIDMPGGIYLHLYAADLARSPDGQWWVVSDRTQAPSGAGYALENRSLIGSQFPELLRSLRVQPLMAFFEALRNGLAQWAPRDDEQPLLVLLTPGPFNETYFEHAYLARYMGLPLVEGQDLTVRHGGVFLKTLSGLRRVHAILRRQDDAWCDPLELRADSTLGVPGLVDAARRGEVLIANALGSGLIESGALLGYLPAIAEHLLGEPLAMPSVATWWCGEEAACDAVLARLPELVIKPAYVQGGAAPVFAADLNKAQRSALAERIRREPREYIGQEPVHLARSPVWDVIHGGLQSRVTGLRVYAAATPQGYTVMPGGLTRVAGPQDLRVISIQRGGGSKDTWVTASAQQELPLGSTRELPPGLVAHEREHGALASRIGENMFWMGRYIERADTALRLLRTGLRAQLAADDAEWPQLLETGHAAGVIPQTESAMTPQAMLLAALGDTTLPGSASSNLQQVVRLARTLRDRLAPDSWRIYNRLERLLGQWRRGPHTLSDALEFLDQSLLALITLSGYAMEHMTRDAGWRFQSLGRRIERMQSLTTWLQHLLVPANQPPALETLIDLSDSVLTYRRRYQRTSEQALVAELLLVDHDNPRGFIYQLQSLLDHTQQLPDNAPGSVDELLLPIIDRLLAQPPEGWVATEERRAQLRRLLSDAWMAGNALATRLQGRYFSHVRTRSTLA
ncbi:MAG: circularly permuted type 2 ATP-grasp protein [Rhodocyclaceae bacterium]